MASFRKLGQKWQAEIRKNNISKSKRFDTKAEAQKWAYEMELSFKGDIKLGHGKTLYDAIQKYIDEVSPSHKGQKSEVLRLKKYQTYKITQKLLQKITREDIQSLIYDRLQHVTGDSVRRELQTLRSVFTYAKKYWKWCDTIPFEDLLYPKKSPPRDRRITDEEMTLVLKALYYDKDMIATSNRHEVALAFLLALETAMRQGELWKVKWVDINKEQRFITLYDTKNGTNRKVPLSTQALHIIDKLEQKNGEHATMLTLGQETAGQIFRRALQLAGIKNLRFHDTRHEALTRLARKLDVLDLARMVGHNDPRSLMIYYNATASEIAQRLG